MKRRNKMERLEPWPPPPEVESFSIKHYRDMAITTDGPVAVCSTWQPDPPKTVAEINMADGRTFRITGDMEVEIPQKGRGRK